MRPVHILVLLLAGALGGAVIMRVLHPGKPWVPATQVVRAQPPVMASVEQLPAAQPVTAVETIPVAPVKDAEQEAVQDGPPPVEAAPVRPSPMPPPVKPLAAREASKPVPVRMWAVPARVPMVAAVMHAAPPQEQPPMPLPQAAPPPAPPPPEAAAVPSTATAVPAEAAAVPERHQATLNAGLTLPVRLMDGLSSERNGAGDAFAATLDKELVADGFVVAERGARVEGRVVAVDKAKPGGSAALAIELTALHTSDGQTVAIQTDNYFQHADRGQVSNATKIAGGAIIGAAIGALAGGGKGAAIGAGLGGGAGTGEALLTRRPAEMSSETVVNFKLKNAVPLTEQLR